MPPKIEIPEGLRPDHHLVLCVSGGKDSTAMALWIERESGLTNPRSYIFSDTGHEHPDTVAHVHQLCERVGHPLNVIEGPFTWLSLAKKKKRFPSAKARFCTEELKVKPLVRWIQAQADLHFETEGAEGFDDPVVVQGIRAAESENRSRLPAWQPGDQDFEHNGRMVRSAYDCPIWRPILRFSADDVFALHREHDMPWNPLYTKGAARVGCFPCIYARKSELKAMFDLDPELLPRLRRYEAEVAEVSGRGAASIFAPNKTPPEFHDRVYVSPEGVRHTYPSIDAVYRWAMNPDQMELDFEGEAPACMSQYGLCE